MAGFLDELKMRVGGQVARNAAQLARIPDRVAELRRIYPEEKARAIAKARAAGKARAEDDIYDAERHARASARATRILGPDLAELAGLGVEGVGLGVNAFRNLAQPFIDGPAPPSFGAALAASGMDLRNNAEGRQAAVEGRAIDPRRLQTTPGGTPEYSFVYDARPDRYRTTAGR